MPGPMVPSPMSAARLYHAVAALKASRPAIEAIQRSRFGIALRSILKSRQRFMMGASAMSAMRELAQREEILAREMAVDDGHLCGEVLGLLLVFGGLLLRRELGALEGREIAGIDRGQQEIHPALDLRASRRALRPSMPGAPWRRDSGGSCSIPRSSSRHQPASAPWRSGSAPCIPASPCSRTGGHSRGARRERPVRQA